MISAISMEAPVPENSRLLSEFSTMGELKKKYDKLQFVKYIYLDPKDNLLKGVNPPSEVPLVPGAYITVAGSVDDIELFLRDLTATSE